MKHNELPGIHRRIVHVCAEKQSAVKPRDAIGEKEYPYLPTATLPNRVPPKISIFFILWAHNSLFLFILFLKFNFTYFRHNYHNHWVFRYVPECSGMFHVPGFMAYLVTTNYSSCSQLFA